MKIPKEFKIVGFTIQVEIHNILPDDIFGCFESTENKIYLASSIKSGFSGTIVQLSEAQIENTFWHEFVHVLQFYLGLDLDEQQAQSFGNLLFEYNNSVKYAD